MTTRTRKNQVIGLTLDRVQAKGYGLVKYIGPYFAVPFSHRPASLQDSKNWIIIRLPHVVWDTFPDRPFE